jgi:hypothetical protein
MGTFLFAHLGVPFLVGLALVFFVAAADREPISWSSCNDIAVDFGILSRAQTAAYFSIPCWRSTGARTRLCTGLEWSWPISC